jgi:hypothetical protein
MSVIQVRRTFLILATFVFLCAALGLLPNFALVPVGLLLWALSDLLGAQ